MAATPNHPNPMIYLRGVRLSDLESVLDFMYHGEVNVAQSDLNSFLAVAEDLQIKGLTQQSTKEMKGKARKAGSAGGSSAKRRKEDDNDDEMKDGVSVKNEPSGGFDQSAPSTSGGTTVTGGFDPQGDGAAYDETYDDGYGGYGAEGGEDAGLIDQGLAGTTGGVEGTDSTKGRHRLHLKHA